MVGPSRFELKTQLPKSCVLPLHHRPIKKYYYYCGGSGTRTRTVITDHKIFLQHLLLNKPTYRFTFSFLSWIHRCLFCCPKEGLGFTHTYEVSLRRISHLPCYFIVTLLYLGTVISCCGLDHFFTILEMLQHIVRCSSLYILLRQRIKLLLPSPSYNNF